MYEKVKGIAEQTLLSVQDVAGSLHSQVESGLPLNLQFFAEPTKPTVPDEPSEPKDSAQPTKSSEPKDPEEKTFTQSELEEIVKQRLARAEKQKLEAIKEAEKLAKMNAQEKQQYEFEKTQHELEEMKKQLNRYELGKEATRILAEKGIVANDTILDLVVRDDAEQTNESVTAFVELLTDLVDRQVREKLKGNAPRKQTGVTGITKQDILNIKDSAERIRAIQENQHLFK